MPTVAEMVEEGMRRKGYTQPRLAAEAGTTPSWINMILRKGKAPGPSALLKIADALELDRGKLVRQAHYERAYDEWKPYLEPADKDAKDERRRPGSWLRVIGTASEAAPGGEVEVAAGGTENGSGEALEAPAGYPGASAGVGFDPESKAIHVSGDGLEPVAYDGQYVVVSPLVQKEEIPDGSIVYVTYELPGDEGPRATVKRMYRYRLPGEEPGDSGLPVYVFVPVNTRLRHKGRSPEPQEAFTLRHRQVREMYPVVGVIFEGTARGREGAGRSL